MELAQIAEVLEGQRKGSTVYEIDNYLFNKEKLGKHNSIYTRCINKQSKKCDARAVIFLDSNEVSSSAGNHTCEQDVLFESMLKLESKMKDIAETTARGIKDIFDEVSLENPEAAAKISF
jgi:hypothetical protein